MSTIAEKTGSVIQERVLEVASGQKPFGMDKFHISHPELPDEKLGFYVLVFPELTGDIITKALADFGLLSVKKPEIAEQQGEVTK